MKKFTILAFFLVASHLLLAQIIDIPNDYPTIQEGIDAANPGETILVNPGTYVENINFNGKNISVGSLYITTLDTSYISQTIIDGNASGSVVTFTSGEDAGALLSGFTIRNGDAAGSGGGGIYIAESSPGLDHLKVINNTAGLGGGIYLGASSSALDDIIISGNSGDGGGIACEEANPVMNNITISNNTAPHYGGALYCVTSPAVISNSFFENNEATNFGGAVFCWDTANISLENTIIRYNTAEHGGGLSIFDSNPVLKGVTVAHNTGTKTGGGLSCTNSVPSFDNTDLCNVFLNKAAEGNDFFTDGLLDIVLDTFSVMSSTDFYTSPLGNYTLTVSNAKKEQTAADLFVSPDGDDTNSGTTTDEPLKTIYQATSLILADSNQKRSITLMEGTFSTQTNGEEFPVNIPDYISLKGASASAVILDADSSAGVIEFLYNTSSRMSGLTLRGGGTKKGAGIYAVLSDLRIENVKLENNNAKYGAALFFDECTSNINNVLIANNNATVNGGGLYFATSEATINNATISSNSAGQMAGGIHNYRSTLTITNTILWDDTPQELAFISSGGPDSYSISLSHSTVQGGEEGIENPANDTIHWQEGNIEEDPVFVGAGADPFQINDTSPCVDAGTPDTIGLNLPEYDLAEEVRIFNDHIDMGAYEWNLFVGVDEPNFTEQPALHIFPNPVNDRLTVSVGTKVENSVKVEIYTVSGTIIKGVEVNKINTGKQELSIHMQTLHRGIYFLRLQIGEEVLTRKVVKL